MWTDANCASPIDPQLDVNVLINLLNRTSEFVTYAQSNSSHGLSYNSATRDEFLAEGKGTEIQLQLLEQVFGIKLIGDVSVSELEYTAVKLQECFQGDELGRSLHEADSRVLSTAFSKRERLATADLKLFKQARDLGIDADFIGTGKAQAKASGYHPRRVTSN
jgi:hypothetical protein